MKVVKSFNDNLKRLLAERAELDAKKEAEKKEAKAKK